jgi:hypothetical protein
MAEELHASLRQAGNFRRFFAAQTNPTPLMFRRIVGDNRLSSAQWTSEFAYLSPYCGGASCFALGG